MANVSIIHRKDKRYKIEINGQDLSNEIMEYKILCEKDRVLVLWIIGYESHDHVFYTKEMPIENISITIEK